MLLNLKLPTAPKRRTWRDKVTGEQPSGCGAGWGGGCRSVGSNHSLHLRRKELKEVGLGIELAFQLQHSMFFPSETVL